MLENSTVYKIENNSDAFKFIEDLMEYTHTGVYNYKLDTKDNELQEVFIVYTIKPPAMPGEPKGFSFK